MIYEEQLPRAIWTRNFRKHILCGGAGSVGALPGRRRAVREWDEERDREAGIGRTEPGWRNQADPGSSPAETLGRTHSGPQCHQLENGMKSYLLCCLV